MDTEPDGSGSDDSEDSVEAMMQHLDEAKQRDRTSNRRRKRPTATSLQRKMQSRTDVAVLASNHESRVKELESNDAVTHRSGKAWKSAKVGVDAHGKLPIYYRMDGEVTHKGYISKIVIDPDENSAEAEELVQHITDDDTYGEYHDVLDTTTFVVTDGERFNEPFPQTELRKLSGDGTIDEGYSRQPAYVIQRQGDFPDVS